MGHLRMSYEDSYAEAFPFEIRVDGMMRPEMIDDTIKTFIGGKVLLVILFSTLP